MVNIHRKLKAKYTGDKEYMPEAIEAAKWMTVIGYQTKMIQRNGENGEYTVEEIYLLVIGNAGKIVPVVHFNMQVMVDDSAELNVTSAMQLLNNVTIIGKSICEYFNKNIAAAPDKQPIKEIGS